MSISTPSIMTDEIAYRLGKLDFPHFYDQVVWRVNQEPFELLRFFDWFLSSGTPCHQVGDEWETAWDSFCLRGCVKFEEIKTISQKLAYIRGRLSSYSVSISPTTITVGYANSYKTCDFFASCLTDVIMDRFVLGAAKDGEPYRCFAANPPKYSVRKSETLGTIPGTPSVQLAADPEVISYIVGPTTP